MSRTRNAVLAALAFAGAYAVGRMTSEPAPAKTERIVERGGERTIVRERGGDGISLDDVRAVVREELKAKGAGEQGVEPAEQPAPDPQRLARAQEALDQGLADGRWTDEDRERLRPNLASLTREELEQIFGKLFPALNSGELRVEVMGPPV